MSAIPPHPIASVLQSGVAQSEAARDADAARNVDDRRARQIGVGPDAVLEVESTDTDDTQVHPDSGGLGSQGRHDAPPDESEHDEITEGGITEDDDGRPHIDLSA
jgi:hypothetical protein